MTVPMVHATPSRHGDMWILVPTEADSEVLIVNQTGYEIFQRCDGTRTVGDIALELGPGSEAETETETATIERDITEFITRLAAAGLIAPRLRRGSE